MTPQDKETIKGATADDLVADITTFVELDALHSSLSEDQRAVLRLKLRSWWAVAKLQSALEFRDQWEEWLRPVEYWKPGLTLPTLERTEA